MPGKTDAGAPRPLQNSDGQRLSPVAARLPNQLAGSQFSQQSPIPPTFGAGLPDDLQGFPLDFQALQQVMLQGYQPGADRFALSRAQNAHALARAMEQRIRVPSSAGAAPLA